MFDEDFSSVCGEFADLYGDGTVDINELQRDLDGISQKVLTDSLRQMIDDGLAYRRDFGEMPPKVEYGLTALGRQMLPIIDALADFGNYYKSVLKQ